MYFRLFTNQITSKPVLTATLVGMDAACDGSTKPRLGRKARPLIPGAYKHCIYTDDINQSVNESTNRNTFM